LIVPYHIESIIMSLGDRLNSSQLKSFSINGLFGFKNIKIPFDKEAMILIAENGSGKTTILNALYYSMSCRFDKLSSIDFSSIILEFSSGEMVESVEIRNSDLRSFYQSYQRDPFPPSSFLRRLLPRREIDSLLEAARMSNDLLRVHFERIIKTYRIPIQYHSRILDEVRIKQEENPESLKDVIKQINANIIATKDSIQNLNETILYFPTYRRIEEDLKNLGYAEEKFEVLNLSDKENKLIQFGMDDVIIKLNEITMDIKNSALNLFSKVTGEILTQFIQGIKVNDEMKNSIKPDTLSIVLSRVGERNIPVSDRKEIEKLVSSGEINNNKYDQLVYFLSKLVDLYEYQKEKDDSINQFATICNNYLNEKQIVYDEANVDISIQNIANDTTIDFRNLSSGEKQIISLFSKIYLEPHEDFIVLFDEPELSLSIEWQRRLLPDILKSDRCKLLLAVTHSPFIFDNELDLNANDLEIFVCKD